MNPSVVLTVVGAAAGLALLLVMAVVPLLTDRYRPRSDRPLRPAASPAPEPTTRTTLMIPAQRRGTRPRAVRLVPGDDARTSLIGTVAPRPVA